MASVIAGITTSVDGYVTGPNDGPGEGLGVGGERLHNWVFGGPWTYEDPSRGAPTGEDAAYFNDLGARIGSVIAGRWTYEAAGHWGERNPWGMPFFVVTHRPEEQPAGDQFTFVGGLDDAVTRARGAAAGKDIYIMGGASIIREALVAGIVDELKLVISPVTLGAGKRLFDGFTESLELEQTGVRQSQFATFIDYRVKRW